MGGQWVLLRKANNTRVVVGPFKSADEAMGWAQRNGGEGVEHVMTVMYGPEAYGK